MSSQSCLTTEPPVPPSDVRPRTRAHAWDAGLFGLCLGTALIVMEANVMNVALPVVRTRMHADAAAGLWVVDAYTLVLAVLLLTCGRIGDRIGARRSYLIGLAVFAVASVLCSLAARADELIAFRALQGLGAALLAPAPLALIAHKYTEPAARARAVSVWVSVGGIGFTVGPLLSGLLVDSLGWRSVFLLNVPVVAITGFLVRRYVAEAPKRTVPFDLSGQLLAVIGLAAIVYGFVETSLTGWGSVTVLGPLLVGTAVLVAFVSVQRRRGRHGDEVLLPPSILSARPVLAGLFSGAVYNFTLYGMLLVYTFVFQSTRHYSAMRTGAAFLPVTLTAIAVSLLGGGAFVARRGPRTGLCIGMALSGTGLVVLALVPGKAPYIAIAAGFVIFALGLGVTAVAQTLAVMSYSGAEHRNAASSSLNAARQTGGVLGVALLGAISSADHSADHSAGPSAAVALAAIACLAAIVVAWRNLPARRSPSASR
ncbi:DHA2 family methylenomycin A resistance protein-like MFS transporter [Catenulispora sp. EB89]|uniref:MFS transporter n=1 Tax=Catenulispora sp. EB89 TaxID=3156257 RepID=UPI003518D1A7